MSFIRENPNFPDILDDEIIYNSQPISLPSSDESNNDELNIINVHNKSVRPPKHTGQQGEFRSIEEIDQKYRHVFSYPFFNIVQSRVIEDALYSDKSMVVCAPTGSGKTVVFEMAIVQLLMEMEDKNYIGDFKIIYMAPVKALCTERLTEWYPKFTKLGLLCIEVTGDTDVEFPQLKPYRIIITTPEKWDMLTRRWKDYRGLVEVVKLFLIDEVHILNDNTRGPVLEAVVSRMKTIESSVQSAHRIEQLQKQYQGNQKEETTTTSSPCPRIRFVAVSATVNNPDDVAAWLSTADRPAVFYKFGDECRPVKLKRVVEGYPCQQGMSIFKFDIILNYKLWPIIQKYHNGKPTLIFCNTRKSVSLTAEALSREITINFNPEQKARLMALASTIKNKKLQSLILSGVGCHHAGLLFEERMNIEHAFRNRDLPILITTTTLAMGVNLPAHLVIIKNTQQYVNGAYQEYSISTILQMVGRAGRPQFDTEATAVIMTRQADKARYQALVGGNEPLQSYLHKRLAENLNSEAALGTVTDVAQCVQWLNSTFLRVRAARDPKRYLGLPPSAPAHQISKKIEELCVRAMNGLASSGLITMDEASCIHSTDAGHLMSVYYIDLETMKLIMKIEGSETLERLLWLVCESHELSDMHLRVDERRCLNSLNRNSCAAVIRFPMKGKINSRQMKLNWYHSPYFLRMSNSMDLPCFEGFSKQIEGTETLKRLQWLVCESHELSDMHLRVDERRCLNSLNRNSCAAVIRFPMKGKINSRQMKLNCVIQATLGCLPIPEPSLNQEATKIMRIADRVCKCLVAYTTSSAFTCRQSKIFAALLNSIVMAKCIAAHLWENSPYVSKQLKGIGPTFSTLLASAGKVNFMLLDESHPRDLERIMNKGPPAGNVLRKQISLLPKYQLTMTPIDRATVNIQLVLQNQSYLAENMDILTAGGNHKSYIIVGDSDNCLLYLSSFKDTDLISLYDGCITCEVTRKHSQEHKIIAHCVSSNFVGIDAHCEYTFVDLEDSHIIHENVFHIRHNNFENSYKGNFTEGTLNERKRKLNTIDITHSKEKQKRDNTLIENVISLKESFGKARKELMENLSKVTNTSNQLLQNVTCVERNLHSRPSTSKNEPLHAFNSMNNQCHDEIDVVDHLDADQVSTILNEIEHEISKTIQRDTCSNNLVKKTSVKDKIFASNINYSKEDYKKLSQTKGFKKNNFKSNFNFIDILEKEMTVSEELDDIGHDEENGFTKTVKFQIDKYLKKAENNTETDIDIKKLLVTEHTLKDDLHTQKGLPCEETVDEDLFIDYIEPCKNNSDIETQRKLVVETTVAKNIGICNKDENNQNNKHTEKPINCYTSNTLKRRNENCSEENMVLNKTIENSDAYVNTLPSTSQSAVNDNPTKESSQTVAGNCNNFNTFSDDGGSVKKTHKKMDEITGLEFVKYECVVNEEAQINQDAKYTFVMVNKIESSQEPRLLEPVAVINSENSKAIQFSDMPLLKEPGNISNMQLNKNSESINPLCGKLLNYSDVSMDDFKERIDLHSHDTSHVENYSLRASKLNIYTKNTPSHKIQIISEWKMDLDVTKIISSKENQEPTGPVTNNTATNVQYDFTNVGDKQTNLINIQPALQPRAVINDTLNAVDNQHKSENSTTIKEQAYELQKPDYKDSNVKDCNKIDNILNKYSKIIRKNINPNNPLLKESTAAIHIKPVNKTSGDRPKRIYKISDIHNLEGQLPKITVTDYQKVNKVNNQITEREADEISRDDYSSHDSRVADILYDISERQLSCKPPLSEYPERVFEINNDILYPDKHYTEQSEPEITCEIKQAILNPKTLLQCYNSIEDEINLSEVIPPPPQFADDSSNVSTSINVVLEKMSPSHTESHHTNSTSESAANEEHYRSIFNDLSQDVDLTPTKEIETWTLSREDCIQDCDLYQNPRKSYTVMRNNFPNAENFRTNFDTNILKPRHARLGQFKFTRKKCNIGKY